MSIFRFKQFAVDQTGCAMKINTDGVLLGALATADQPENILDIGTGTGVIALMLAQRFIDAKVDAVEIDTIAAQTAGNNFNNSPFANRLSIHPIAFEGYFKDHAEKKFDLIVSNPPFHINSLESPKAKKALAKHTGEAFFIDLIKLVARHLTENGSCWLVLPLETSALVKELAARHDLHLQKVMAVQSFVESQPHREIVCLGLNPKEITFEQFVIYDEPKVYSEIYQHTLKNFFTIF